MQVSMTPALKGIFLKVIMNTSKFLQSLVDNLSLSELITLRDMVNEKLDVDDNDDESQAAQTILKARVRQLWLEGQRLAAVKLYKEETGMGLKEAKDTVDEMCKDISAIYS